MQHVILLGKFLTKQNFSKWHQIICLTLILKVFMKLHKDYTKESYSVLENDTTFFIIESIKIREKLIIEMSICQKIKAIRNKIAQYKAQYDLGRQTAKMFASSLEMLVNMNFLHTKMFFQKKTC